MKTIFLNVLQSQLWVIKDHKKESVNVGVILKITHNALIDSNKHKVSFIFKLKNKNAQVFINILKLFWLKRKLT